MTRAELDELRATAAGWKPGQHVEVGVGRLRALLDHVDQLEAEVGAFREGALAQMSPCPGCGFAMDEMTTFFCNACGPAEDVDDAG